ncbi:hypothetical protein GGI43DRAFT_56995 [Trichoderma evansii]
MSGRDLVAFFLSFICYYYLYIQVVPFAYWCYLCDIIWRDIITFLLLLLLLYTKWYLCATIGELRMDWTESWIVLDLREGGIENEVTPDAEAEAGYRLATARTCQYREGESAGLIHTGMII